MSDLAQRIRSAQSVSGSTAGASQFKNSSMLAALLRQWSERKEQTFMIYYAEQGQREEISYDTFVRRVLCTANYLHSKGISTGSRFVTAAYNHPDTIVQYFAAWALGACVVPLNMSEDDDRLNYIMGNCGARLVLVREDYRDRIQSLTKDIAIECICVDADYHAAVAASTPYDAEPQDSLDAECLIVYTSGTTGHPKGVVLVQRNLMADGEGIAYWHSIDETQRMMCVLPIHHVNGTIVTHVTPFLAGASVVLNRKFQTDTFFERIRSEKVNIVSVVPTLLAFLLEANANAEGVREAGLRHIICGAGPLTCELARRFEDHYAIRILHGYGLSETTCYSCFLECDLSDDEHRYWMHHFGFPSIGTPIRENEMAIHDPEGRELGENERGEIVIRGWNVMKEYYQNTEANDKTFAFGWFRSGDEGFRVRSPKGKDYYFITGRLKELIIRGGVNLAPLEIDEVINRAPGVKAGISVGFENDMYGEEVGALVIAHDGANVDSILEFCQKELPFSKAPKVVLFADALPVTSTGKYQRSKVKHLFTEWKATQFRAKHK